MTVKARQGCLEIDSVRIVSLDPITALPYRSGNIWEAKGGWDSRIPKRRILEETLEKLGWPQQVASMKLESKFGGQQ